VGVGALVEGSGTRFRVWAPRPRRVELELISPVARRVALAPAALGEGYLETFVPGVGAGARYAYRLDGDRLRPDPASRAQPDGVHGPSEVVDPGAFPWRHPPVSRRLDELVFYELHAGTFTPAGTFDDAAAELPRLVDLGVTAVELMPVASFPGARNWGYDGVAWLAPQRSYGGPDGLRRFVDACHGHGLAVIADVVFNHLGPEGNYLAELGPYFTSRHTTPWGDALDYTNPAVRRHVLAAARMYIDEYRFDGLRLDAVHAMTDDSPRHMAAEVAASMHELGAAAGRTVHVIAESDLGDARVVERAPRGWGCDAQWSDDLHHALHALITGERQGHYVDFGAPADLARAVAEGFVYTGQWSSYRKRPFGTPSKHLGGARLVVCAQNHDQVGNRARGERLAQLVPGAAHAAAAVVLTAPALPLIFMGEEHADPAPFLYFTDHQDAALGRAVTDGRRREFGGLPSEIPDPQAPATFAASRIDLKRGDASGLRAFYRALIAVRRERPSLRALDKTRTDARAVGAALLVRRWSDADEVLVALNLAAAPAELALPRAHTGRWSVIFDAGEPRFGGPRGAFLDAERLTARLPPWGVLIVGAH
jgi:maltooligosyltrehalose trehalohydrolase